MSQEQSPATRGEAIALTMTAIRNSQLDTEYTSLSYIEHVASEIVDAVAPLLAARQESAENQVPAMEYGAPTGRHWAPGYPLETTPSEIAPMTEAERLSEKWLATSPVASIRVDLAGALLRDALHPTAASIPSAMGCMPVQMTQERYEYFLAYEAESILRKKETK